MTNNEKLAADLADEILGSDMIDDITPAIFEALNAAHAEGYKQGAAREWQPIESAPKDGSVFQAIFSQDWDESQLDGEHSGWLHLPRLPFNCKWVENYFEDEPEDESGAFVEVDKCGMGDDDVEPAYWMPLPEAPKGGV